MTTDGVTTDRPRLTIREAADAAGVSQRTVRRRVAAGAFPGAAKDETDPFGPWTIPVEDLLAAGFTLYAPTPEAPALSTQVDDAEVAHLRAELDLERVRRQAAEAIAADRLARAEAAEHALAAVTEALAAIGPGETAAAPAPVTETPQPRRRWGIGPFRI